MLRIRYLLSYLKAKNRQDYPTFKTVAAITYEAKMQKFSGTLEKLSPLSAIHIIYCAFIG